MNFFQALQKLVQTIFKPAPKPAPKPAAPAPKPVVQAPKPVAPSLQPNFTSSQPAPSAQMKPAPQAQPTLPPPPPPQPPQQQQGQSQPTPQPSQSTPQPVQTAPTPQSTTIPKPMGGTATPTTMGAVGATSGNVTGMPSSALPGQNQSIGIKGISSGVVSGLTPDFGGAQPASAQMTPQLPKTSPNQISQQALSQINQGIEARQRQTQQAPVHPGSWFGLPDIGLTEKVGKVLGAETTSQGGSSLRGLVGIPGMGVTPQSEGAFSEQNRRFVDEEAKPIKKGSDQTGKTLSAGVTDSKGIQSQINQVVEGKGNLYDVAANIASPTALPEISKAMVVAQNSGDMFAVQKLADLAVAVQQNMKFQQQMGQIITALAAGFGTPNAPGVTEARLPQVQQGVFQGLEGSPTMSNVPPGAPGSQIPYLPSNIRTANPTQQNRPMLKPYLE